MIFKKLSCQLGTGKKPKAASTSSTTAPKITVPTRQTTTAAKPTTTQSYNNGRTQQPKLNSLSGHTPQATTAQEQAEDPKKKPLMPQTRREVQETTTNAAQAPKPQEEVQETEKPQDDTSIFDRELVEQVRNLSTKWSNADDQAIIEALQEAGITSSGDLQACSSNADFFDMPMAPEIPSTRQAGKERRIIIPPNAQHVALEVTTVSVRGNDGSIPTEIITPFKPEEIEGCTDFLGTSGQGNGLQFVQCDNSKYSDQCLGMSAIYGAMLMGQSSYMQQTGGEWTLTGIGTMFDPEHTGHVEINGCDDMDNFQKVTFGNRQEARSESAEEMKTRIIEEINNGNPVIVEVGAIHSKNSLSRHYVTAVGYTPEGDIVTWDPFTGDYRTLNFNYESKDAKGPKGWIKGHDGDRVPVQGKDVGKSAESDNPYAFQIYVWKHGTPVSDGQRA